MLRCDRCGIDLPGNPLRCPLCQSALSGTPDNTGNRFPVPNTLPKASRKLLALIAFGTVCASVISVVINLIRPAGGWWSLFVITGFASLWIDFAVLIRKRNNLTKDVLWQAVVVSLLAYLWDRFTGFHGWSLDYVLPILCTCAMIAITLIAQIQKLHIQDYILYLFMDCMLGIISFVLIRARIVRVITPCAICFGASVIFLAALLFFERKALWEEIQRRLHW
ncbi:DUF6320 domain-containing protein [Eubacteriales bacterium mix99]